MTTDHARRPASQPRRAARPSRRAGPRTCRAGASRVGRGSLAGAASSSARRHWSAVAAGSGVARAGVVGDRRVLELARRCATVGATSRRPGVPLVAWRRRDACWRAYAAGADGLVVALAADASLAVAGLAAAPTAPDGYLRDVTAGLFVAVYVPLPRRLRGAAARPGRRRRAGSSSSSPLTVCSDIGGYAAGVLFGRHPMAPTISPKKSWEGFAGSVRVLRCVGGAGPAAACSTAHWWQGVLFGLAVVVTRDARRPRRVDDQARPRHQGHGQPAARPRRPHGPARLPAAPRPGRVLLLARLASSRSDRRAATARLDLRAATLADACDCRFAAPRRGQAAARTSPTSRRRERRPRVAELGEPAFRAAQLSTHYFGRLRRRPRRDDRPAGRRPRAALAEALLPDAADPGARRSTATTARPARRCGGCSTARSSRPC